MARLTSPSILPALRAVSIPYLLWETCCWLALAAIVILHGYLVISASGNQQTNAWSHLLEAGQAVRHASDIYAHHFTGSPLLALLASPFANLPDSISLAICYLINMVCIALSVHWLASAVEVNHRRWWYHRIMPVALMALPLGTYLTTDITQALVLLLVARLFVSLMHGQTFGAGVWLAGAVTVHLTSIILVLLQICRRDRVMSMGTTMGLMLGLLLLPGLVFGLQQTNRLNTEYVQSVKLETRQAMAQNDNPSLLAITQRQLPSELQANLFPAMAITTTALGFLMIMTCGMMNWRSQAHPLQVLHLVGAMLAVMSLAEPGYSGMQLCYLLPAILGIIVDESPHSTFTMVMIVFAAICCSLSNLQMGLPLLGTFAIWMVSVSMLNANNRQSTGTTTADMQVDLPAKLPRAA